MRDLVAGDLEVEWFAVAVANNFESNFGALGTFEIFINIGVVDADAGDLFAIDLYDLVAGAKSDFFGWSMAGLSYARKAVSGPPPFRLVTAAITRDYPHLLAALEGRPAADG